METIEELFQEMLDDEDLRASFAQALESDRLEAFLQESGCEAAPSEVREALEGMFREELDDELLDEVNGGMAKYRLNIRFSDDDMEIIRRASSRVIGRSSSSVREVGRPADFTVSSPDASARNFVQAARCGSWYRFLLGRKVLDGDDRILERAP